MNPYNYLTKEILDRLPALYATEDIPLIEKVVQVQYFTPDSNWSWYAFEYSPETQTFFGLVVGRETEFGYFTLDQLKSVRGNMGLKVEREIYTKPKPLGEVQNLELPSWVKE